MGYIILQNDVDGLTGRRGLGATQAQNRGCSLLSARVVRQPAPVEWTDTAGHIGAWVRPTESLSQTEAACPRNVSAAGVSGVSLGLKRC